MRLVIFGGEALELSSLRRGVSDTASERPRLVNMYGITETTVHVTYRELSAADDEHGGARESDRASAGDLELYVLDEQLEPVPVGVAGRAVCGRRGTGARLSAAAGADGGAVCAAPVQRRWRSAVVPDGRPGPVSGSDGELEYLGRADEQVKIRGLPDRVGRDRGGAAGQHEAVRGGGGGGARGRGRREEAGGVCGGGGGSGADGDGVAGSFAGAVAGLHGAGGVCDAGGDAADGERESRPAGAAGAGRRAAGIGRSYVAPRNEREQALAEIWSQVLGVEQVGVDDNFFALGGDSIRSIQIISKAEERGLKFSIQQLFEHATVAQLAECLLLAPDGDQPDRVRTAPFSLVKPEDRAQLPEGIADAYPLTMLQAGMIFHSEYSPESAVYHDIFTYELRAKLDEAAMRETLRELLRRHAALRTSFAMTGYSEPLQLVHDEVEFPLSVSDISDLDAEAQEETIRNYIEADRGQSFAWDTAPLMKMHLHRRGEEVFHLTLSFHHALMDGWSFVNLLRELFQHYLFLIGKEQQNIEPAPELEFREFVALEQEAIHSPECQQFWQQRLKGHSGTMLPRWPASASDDGRHETHTIVVETTAEMSAGLKRLAQQAAVPIKSVLLAAHLRVLSLLSGQRDVITGVVWNGRLEERDGERVVGLFLNTLPFRQQLRGGSWPELAREVFENERETLPFRRYPLSVLQQKQGGQPLFETAFNFLNYHVLKEVLAREEMQATSGGFFEETSIPLFAQCGVNPQNSEIYVMLKYDVHELKDAQMKAIAGYYAKVLNAMASSAS